VCIILLYFQTNILQFTNPSKCFLRVNGPGNIWYLLADQNPGTLLSFRSLFFSFRLNDPKRDLSCKKKINNASLFPPTHRSCTSELLTPFSLSFALSLSLSLSHSLALSLSLLPSPFFSFIYLIAFHSEKWKIPVNRERYITPKPY